MRGAPQYLLRHSSTHRKNTMRSLFAGKQTTLALACALALGVFSASLYAQDRNPNETALLLDTRGAPVMNATELCWHTAYGPPPAWTAGCHPQAKVLAQYVAPVAAPVAVPVAAAAPLPIYEKAAFDASVLFDSDKSALRPAGRDTLDAFLRDIRGLDSQSIVAVGYADRMGSDAANQVLSEERVDAVKTYLVDRGVAADRVQTRAVGETRPGTPAGDCKSADKASNVACMQADRRVLIEVSGMRLAK